MSVHTASPQIANISSERAAVYLNSRILEYLYSVGQGRLRHINDGANAPWKNRGEGFCRNLGGEVRKLFTSFTTVLTHCYLLHLQHCSCFRDVVIDQIIGLHCIEVSSNDCCHQVSDFKAKMHQILSNNFTGWWIRKTFSCHFLAGWWLYDVDGIVSSPSGSDLTTGYRHSWTL